MIDRLKIDPHLQTICEAARQRELGIVAYITAGDPTLDASLEFVLALAEREPMSSSSACPSAIRWQMARQFNAHQNGR